MPEEFKFPEVEFKGKLRPSQQQVVQIARKRLQQGQQSLHIVAPPGSGKTVLGLYLWACLIQRPCLVLSPNSAIQSQWASRTDLFELGDRPNLVSTDPQSPQLLTSLTYQSLTMPARNLSDVKLQAIELWIDKLIEKEQVIAREEGRRWIEDLQQNNVEYFRQQLANYQKKIRDEKSKSGESLELLHPSSRDSLSRLAEKGVGVMILDECHHLMGHWGRVLADAKNIFDRPIVIGLTATPPDRDGIEERDLNRYDTFFGPIDFEVPVPAVVKDGFLSPYQDLAYFVRPTPKELGFVASADEQLSQLVERVCANGYLGIQQVSRNDPVISRPESILAPSNLPMWLHHTLEHRRLPTGEASDWSSFERRDPTLALAGRQFLLYRGLQLPDSTPPLAQVDHPFGGNGEAIPDSQFVIPVLDRFVRHFLRRSSDSDHQLLAKEITASLRTLGVQITDTGTRACTSPVGRVMAYSKSKADALIPILKSEMKSLGESIRAVVITDFEKSSAVSAKLKDLMDTESGGAIAAFKTLLSDEETDLLDPILLTGSTILIDDEIEESFLKMSHDWLAHRNLNVQLDVKKIDDFRQVVGRGRDWAPRVYVELVTEIFQNGLTKCLIGTRGLLGEGWDANRINVLVDLTTVTTSMSINQLRGRSFRLDPNWKEKTANNWDVVCLAPEFTKGFDDYRRFKEKHQNLFGVTDDGAIEKGVGHVHPAFTEIKPEGLESDLNVFNAEMLLRSQRRDHVRGLWKIGEPFQNQSIRAVEVKSQGGTTGGFPPFSKTTEPWSDRSLTEAIATAVLSSLLELQKIEGSVQASTRELTGGYVRTFLKNATDDDNRLFAEAMKQVLGPLERPRYVIPRSVNRKIETMLSRFLPEIIGKYFRKTSMCFAQLHAVPGCLGRNRSEVDVFQTYWNTYVSPGEAIYALRGDGQTMVQEARAQPGHSTILHEKDIFV